MRPEVQGKLPTKYAYHQVAVWTFDKKTHAMVGFAKGEVAPGGRAVLESVKGHAITFTLGQVKQEEVSDEPGGRLRLEPMVEFKMAHGTGSSQRSLALDEPKFSVEYGLGEPVASVVAMIPVGSLPGKAAAAIPIRLNVTRQPEELDDVLLGSASVGLLSVREAVEVYGVTGRTARPQQWRQVMADKDADIATVGAAVLARVGDDAGTRQFCKLCLESRGNEQVWLVAHIPQMPPSAALLDALVQLITADRTYREQWGPDVGVADMDRRFGLLESLFAKYTPQQVKPHAPRLIAWAKGRKDAALPRKIEQFVNASAPATVPASSGPGTQPAGDGASTQPTPNGASTRVAKVDQAQQDVFRLEGAIGWFRAQAGRNPTSEEGLAAVMKQPERIKGWKCPDIRDVLNDPWGRPYVYVGHQDGFSLFSLGPDGLKGTGDDVTAWSVPSWVRPATTQPATSAAPARIARLISQLKDDSVAIREAAQKELVRIGLPAVGALNNAAAGQDTEASLRAKTVLRQIEEQPWGQGEKGVQARLHPLRSAWQAGQTPKLSLEVRNRGQTTWSLAELRYAMGSFCRIEWDGQWYEWSDPPRSFGGNVPKLRPGEAAEAAVELVRAWVSVKEGQRSPLALTPGRHIVRIHVQLYTHDNSAQCAQAVSDPVFVEIGSPPATQPAPSASSGQTPNGASTQPATTQPAVSAEKPSTLAICIVANTTKQADREAMIPADEADKWKKQLADQGPKAPTKHQRYWWAELGESMMPPPQALIADYRGKPHILLCADWPQAVTPWREAAFRCGIVKAQAVAGAEGKQAVEVTYDKSGTQGIVFMVQSYKGLSVAYAIDGVVQAIEPITDAFGGSPVIRLPTAGPQAEALARRLLAGMPAVKAMDQAVQEQKIEEVRSLLDANPVLADAPCDWPDSGRGPLHTAVGLGSPEIVHLLLDRGANVNAVDKRGGDTPLHQAAASTNIDIVRLLLDRGASASAPRRRDLNTPLHLAVTNGRDEIIRLLLERGADLKAVNKQEFTPLHTAAGQQSVSAARILLDAGAEVNYAGKAGVTPLDMVVLMETMQRWRQSPPEQIEKTKAVADLLRRRGGKVGIVGAAAAGDIEAVRGFIKADPAAIHRVAFEYMTPLVAAAMAGHVPVAELLIDAGAPVNPPADSPVSALMMAAGAGHLDAAKLLVARGADVNFAGEGTALTAAAYQGHRQIVEFLLDKGAKPGDESGDGSALTAAARNGQVEIVKLLLDRGMDVNARTRRGQTALIALASSTWPLPPAKGVMETAKLLIDRGADVNARDSQDQTALAYTINTPSGQAINMDMVKLLIDHGADVNVKAIGAQGTLLHRAAEKDDPTLAKLLIDAGADVFSLNSSVMGQTPLELAEQSKASRAAEVIRKAAEPKVEAMRAKVIESLQPFLDAISKADAKAAVACVLPNEQVSRSNWESWIDDQCKIMTNSPGRILVPGIIEIRSGFAVAAVTDAAARPNRQTVITLLGCEDGTWRPVKHNSAEMNGMEEFLKDELRGAATFLSSMRLAVLYKAGKLTGPAPNSNMGGSLTDLVRTIEMIVSDGMLTCDFRGGSVPLQWTVQVGPDRVLQWSYGRSGLSWGRALKLTRNDGLVLEARDGKVTITKDESKNVLQAVGGRVRMTSGDNTVTASKLVLDLDTLKSSTPNPPATQPATVPVDPVALKQADRPSLARNPFDEAMFFQSGDHLMHGGR